MSSDWSPDSWQSKPVEQIPTYPDEGRLREVLRQLSKLPPLVTSWEVETLRSQLAEAARGERFLLQGGDCSENFDECESDVIAGKLKILLQMSLVLIHGSKKRVIRVGRFAGQYAKPRSSDTETRDGVTLPSYRGDLVNRLQFVEKDRTPDPDLLLRGYERAALTLNFIRSLMDGGFADLHHPEYWDLGFVTHSPQAGEYWQMVATIGESIRFMEAISGTKIGDASRVDFFTSHEGLHLHYEQAQTRQVPRRTGWYDLSTHFPWIGQRTRGVGGGHVEFFRGIRNPVGVKIGPSIAPDELLALSEALNPNNEDGRLTLTHRFGVQKIGDCLPPLIDAVEGAGKRVLWCCDPMHGNTETTPEKLKTRDFQNILGELDQAFEIHRKKGTYLGGVHFELTGENVTECTGGARGLKAADLQKAYKTQVDPRLNYEQALEMAMLVAQRMNRP
ncbi:MAG: 3-deoxy-7-phosphoheptulonate synthase class II [Planctomycetota bacterium]|nr:3-deoxy-7-phosphoheptulonate synthase class II [Planctomycetota bacterium]